MSTTILTDNIQNHLFRLTDLIELSNSLNRNSRTVDAENLFCTILNKTFGWHLINANERMMNQDSYDLIDEKEGILVQITSNKNHKKKFNSTLGSLQKGDALTNVNKVIVLFITRKCSPALLKKFSKDGIEYEAYDIPKLLKAIYYQLKKPSELAELNAFLEAEVSPVAVTGVNNGSSDVLNFPKPAPLTMGNGLYIPRKKLVEELFSFAQLNNGLIVGGPGFGKSFTIEELQRFCETKGVHCIVIKINELLDGNNEEISEELCVKTNWLKAIKNSYLNQGQGKSLLIFDAFDTAKDERLKTAILKQIKKATAELSAQWSILVSVRTFDASKSIRLRELFPSSNINNQVSCRNIAIPELSEDELNQALKSNPALLEIFRKSTPSLQALLRVPYFLKLLEKILYSKNKLDDPRLISIETEEQLLQIFWEDRVSVNTDADLLLQKITSVLTTEETLSCRKEKVLTEMNTKMLTEMISLGILEESSATKQNISFTHNILLEYAVSRYLIPENKNELVSYVSENSKLPFIFRQSFIYFYSRLWKVDADLFWQHYFKTRAIHTPLFRLYHQSILNFVLGGFFNDTTELEPVFSLEDKDEKGNIIRKILEGVRFLNKDGVRQKDYRLLLESSKHISHHFIWELGLFINKAILQLEIKSNVAFQKIITEAAINYLNFILKERKSSINKWILDANGLRWGVENVIKVYFASKMKARRLLNEVLLILKEDGFPIPCFWILADKLLILFTHDYKFAVRIYRELYYHTEMSDKETYLGNNVILNLRSNRSQDFEGIHHKLERDYKQILETVPEAAIKLGIEIVNRFNVEKGKSYRKRQSKIVVKGIVSKLVHDYSFYDSEHDKEYGPNSHLENIFKYLESLQKGAALIKLITIIITHAEAGRIWRKLLEFLAEHPRHCKSISYSLLQNEVLYISNDTSHETGKLLQSLWTLLSIPQQTRLENLIWSLENSPLLKEQKDLATLQIGVMLSCIPPDQLRLSKSSAFLQENGHKENHPIVSTIRVEKHEASRDEKMARSGVDASNSTDVKLYDAIEKLEAFNSKYDSSETKEKPSDEEFRTLLSAVKELFDLSKSAQITNERLAKDVDYEVSLFNRLLARHSKPSKSTREFIEEVSFFFIENATYLTNQYEEGDLKSRGATYSLAPRIEATKALALLLNWSKSDKIASVVLSLMQDNSTIIRHYALNVACHFWHFQRDNFWDIIERRIQRENDGLCFHDLIRSVCYDNMIVDNKAEIEKIARLIQNRLTESNDASNDIWQVYVVLLLKLFINHNSVVAKEIIYEAIVIKEFAKAILFKIVEVIDPHDKANNYCLDPTKYDSLVHILHEILKQRFESIKAKGLKSVEIHDDFEIVDIVIMQLFFTLQSGKKANKGNQVSEENKIAFYHKLKPLLKFIVDESIRIESGFMVAHTGYYFLQLLNSMLFADTEFILGLSADMIKCASANNFTYDQTTLQETVKLAEQLLADHKEILLKPDNFEKMIAILDLFANSGWQEALELTWRLKECF